MNFDLMRLTTEQHSKLLAMRTSKTATSAAALERAILPAVLRMLRLHPKVAWAVRLNAGAFVVGAPGKERHVRAGFRGCADIWFQLKDGRLGVCEVKRQGAHPTADQQAFLDRVASHNGVAFVARGPADVVAHLEALA